MKARAAIPGVLVLLACWCLAFACMTRCELKGMAQGGSPGMGAMHGCSMPGCAGAVAGVGSGCERGVCGAVAASGWSRVAAVEQDAIEGAAVGAVSVVLSVGSATRVNPHPGVRRRPPAEMQFRV